MNLQRIQLEFYKISRQYESIIRLYEKKHDKSINDYSNLAESYSALYLFKKSLSYRRQIFEIEPENFRNIFLYAGDLYDLGEYSSVKPLLEKAIILFRNNNNDNKLLSMLYVMLGNCDFALSNYVEANYYYDLALDIIPWNYDAILRRASILRTTNNFDDVVPYLEEYQNKFPDLYPIYIYLAEFYCFGLFNFSMAIQYSEKAIELITDKNRKYQEYEKYCEYNINISEGYMVTLIMSGRIDDALDLIRVLYKSGIDNFAQYEMNYIKYLFEIGNWIEARKVLEKRVANNRDKDPYHLCLLYTAELHVENSELALYKLQQLYSIYQPMKSVCLSYGDALLFREAFNKAESIFYDLVTRFPLYDEYREKYAYCLLRLSKNSSAIIEYEKLMAQQPYNGEISLALGLCYFRNNLQDKGIKLVRNAYSEKKFYHVNKYIERQCQELLSDNCI